MNPHDPQSDVESPPTEDDQHSTGQVPADGPRPREIGGPKGPEPTRYGDWERKGRCIDF